MGSSWLPVGRVFLAPSSAFLTSSLEVGSAIFRCLKTNAMADMYVRIVLYAKGGVLELK